MKYLIAVSFFLSFSFSFAQDINIIPQPVEIKKGKGNFILDNTVKIATTYYNEAFFLQDYLRTYYKIELEKSDVNIEKKIIILGISELLEDKKKGGYRIYIKEKEVAIIGDDREGLFSGIQTLIQLLPTQNQKPTIKNSQLSIPQLSITDYPRFAYRGMHLDVSRHFMPVGFIKKYIDYIAFHKMNYFHWHLTDDQGWRIEIKKYPKLTQVGAWRNGTIIGRYPGNGNDGLKYGGFYTQEQIKEIVKYAADRYITVVPEIEMPGHSSAAIAAYPELSCFPNEPTITYFPKQCKWNGDSSGKQVQQTWGVFDDVFCAGQENTFKFMEDVMDEVLALFPSTYIHVGGDECPKENWKRCPNCQKRIKDNNLKDEHELQSYFIQRMEKYLNNKGRTLVGWDEILEGGLAPNAAVMSWRGEQGGIDAAKQNHDVIMTPGNPVYFDHSQSENEDSVTIGGYNPIEKVYAYEPVPSVLNAQQANHILGAQANMWTEYIDNPKKAEYMLFPRISALSELLWSPKEKRDWNDFEKRLMVQFKRYDLWKANNSKAFFDLKAKIVPSKNFNGIRWSISNGYSTPSRLRISIQQKTNEKIDTIAVYDINDISKIVRYVTTDSFWRELKRCDFSEDSILIEKTGHYSATTYKLKDNRFETMIDRNYTAMSINQKFYFNKATGKKITLTSPPSKNYPGDGPFTLVNGIVNEKGMGRAKEFLGFSGTDCEAVIDLGSSQLISFVVVNLLHQPSSWIWRPQTAEVLGSGDGVNYYTLKLTDDFEEIPKCNSKGKMTMAFKATYAQYIKVVVKNWGEIPEGNPGAGNKAWLFVDEIEVN